MRNEAGVVATAEGLQQFDTDGSPITVGATKLTSKGPVEKDYLRTPPERPQSQAAAPRGSSSCGFYGWGCAQGQPVDRVVPQDGPEDNQDV